MAEDGVAEDVEYVVAVVGEGEGVDEGVVFDDDEDCQQCGEDDDCFEDEVECFLGWRSGRRRRSLVILAGGEC